MVLLQTSELRGVKIRPIDDIHGVNDFVTGKTSYMSDIINLFCYFGQAKGKRRLGWADVGVRSVSIFPSGLLVLVGFDKHE